MSTTILVVNSGGSSDLSDEDFNEGDYGNAGGGGGPELQGTLSKWTNYIHGWQDRYMALKDGTLVYYKSEHETDFGCRGAISLSKAIIKPHELDDLRFDISVSSDCVWYLRASSLEDRIQWIDSLEAFKKVALENESPGELNTHLRRHDSALSLTSNTFSTSSRGTKTRGHALSEKLSEMETFRDICCKQIDNLQSVFDYAVELDERHPFEAFVHSNINKNHTNPLNNDENNQNNIPNVDFKGESITFKATTAGIIATLSHCIDLMNQREDYWKKKVEKEQIIRKRIEEKYQNKIDEAKESESENLAKVMLVGNPDYEEGPHSQIGEEEFYDAVENALDKLQEEQDYRDKLKLMSAKQMENTNVPLNNQQTSHPLWDRIEQVTSEQLHIARLPVGDIWELFAEDGEMKMYKREEEIDGVVVDPLKAVHQVKGVTARELCHYFFSPDVRTEWETTVEHATVLEKISDDTLIFLQLHKRLWPSAQRDSLFWSHRRQIKDIREHGSDTWLVCNQSTKHPDAPENAGNCMRIDLRVIFVCDTELLKPTRNLDTVSREDISCKITYCSVVNPGGWVPANAFRAVYKREYPKFLKRFTAYVIDKTKNKAILW